MSGTSGDGQTRPTIEEELRLRFGSGREAPPSEMPQFELGVTGVPG